VRAFQTDLANNVSANSTALDITVDTTAPAAPAGLDRKSAEEGGGDDTDNITSQTTELTISGAGEDVATATRVEDVDNNGVKECGEATLGIAIVGGGILGIDVALGEGVHPVRAFQTDLANNVSANSTALDITVDTTAPAAPAG